MSFSRSFSGVVLAARVVWLSLCLACHTSHGAITSITPSTSDPEPLVAEAVLRNDPTQPSYHLFYLPAKLWGHTVSFILDTGTGFHLLLFTPALSELTLTPPHLDTTARSQASDATITGTTLVDSLIVGTTVARTVPATVGHFAAYDTTHTPAGMPPLVGILGNMQLPHYDLVFDGPAGRVALYQIAPTTRPWEPPQLGRTQRTRGTWLPAGFTPADCLPLRPPTPTDHSVYIPVVINGYAVESWLDSGSNGTVMNGAAAKLLGITQHTPHLQRIQDSPAHYELHDVPVSLGTHRVVVPVIQISASGKDPYIQFGLDAFRNRRMLVSYSTGQFCLTSPR